MVVESFPQTANGKLDRKALPDPVVEEQKVEEVQAERVDAAGQMTLYTTAGDSFTMAQHVSDIVHRLRGYRPGPSVSLSSIGIDSLGSILFVRCLSESLGGMRIEVKTVFGTGVTVASLADVLQQRLKKENPSLLTEMGIEDAVVVDLEGGARKVHGGGGQVQVEAVPETMEVEGGLGHSIDEEIMRDNEFLIGLRGVLTVMVLWDHFHGYHVMKQNQMWFTDTNMFVILSGFTTSLQLRPTRINSAGMEREGGKFTLWNWRSFVFSRFVGVFPCLWLALFLNIPRWVVHDHLTVHQRTANYHYGNSYICAFLYVIGMQTRFKDRCYHYGPYDVYYASTIWNCFLTYAAFRILVDYCQKMIRAALVAKSRNSMTRSSQNTGQSFSSTTLRVISSRRWSYRWRWSWCSSLQLPVTSADWLRLFDSSVTNQLPGFYCLLMTLASITFMTLLIQILKVTSIITYDLRLLDSSE